MAIEKNLPLDDYLGIKLPDDPQDTATPKSRAADDYLGLGALGGQTNAPASEARQATDYLGLGALGGTGTGITVNPVTASTATTDPVKPKRKYTYTDEETGDLIDVYEDDTEVIRKKGTVKLDATKAAEATAAATLAKKVSAFDILRREFTAKGLGFLVEAAENAIMNEDSDAGRLLALRSSPAYQLRFSANAERIKKGLTALDEATYLGMEDQYQEVMRQYGLPESYYTKDATGKQPGFEQLLANDVSNVELADRLMVAQDRVLKADPNILNSLKSFYGDSITNGDILAYTLDPKNAIKDIQRKVTAAEIGAAQTGAGLQATLAGAERLAANNVTGAQYQQAAPTIAEASIRGGQLASIYGESPYTQQTAEQAVLNTPGSAEAIRQTKKLTALETASFSGQSGRGAIDRERSGAI
jgi:hypothetical protein